MASIIAPAARMWHYIFTECIDERTADWFLVGSPIPPLAIMFVYYQFVTKIGPALMKDRKPFQIDRIIQVYNVAQVLVCGWLAFNAFSITFGPYGSYEWTCQPADTTKSPLGIQVAGYSWIYYMIKLFDLLDTVFFILRKKFNQVSFLHVYHHMGVIMLGYIGCSFFPDGHGFLIIPLNSAVHCFMYTYYLLSNYDSSFRKNIWWKKYITQIQLVQFCIIEYHVGKVIFMPSCNYSLVPVLLLIPQNTFVLYLFLKFYKSAYLTPNKPLKSS